VCRLRSGGIELWFDPTYRMLPSATMIRAALCPPGGFDERLTYTNDWLFDIEVFRHGRCVAIDDVLVRYRRHGDNFTTRADASGASYEEGMMAMALVTARYPELARRARTMSTALMLGQARRHAARREWGAAAGYGRAAHGMGGSPECSGWAPRWRIRACDANARAGLPPNEVVELPLDDRESRATIRQPGNAPPRGPSRSAAGIVESLAHRA